MAKQTIGWKIPDYLLLGFAISSIGGPLALATISLNPASGASNVPATLLIGIALFSAVIMIWMRYSDKIASSGGLYSFVKSASGEKVARIQGIIWIFSYFLYLPYTITYVVFYILPSIFSVTTFDLYFLEVALPILISAIILSSRKLPFYLLFLLALVQVAIVLVLAAAIFNSTGFNPGSVVPSLSLSGLGKGGAGLALLFICADLPLFLGAEAKGRGRSIKKVLLTSFIIVAALLFIFSLAISGLPVSSGESDVFGFSLAQQYVSNLFADIVGIFAILSLLGLVIAEFIGLSRLIPAMFKISMSKTIIWISVAFIFLDLVSLINPDTFYNYTVLPSIVALYASQLIVFFVYPMFRSKLSRLSVTDIVITVVASLLIIYAIYGLATGYSSYLLQ